MSETFQIVVDDTKAQAWFGKLIERGSNLSGLMRDIGEAFLESTWARFDAGVGPDGVAWAPLADGSGRSPLMDSRRMRDLIAPLSGDTWVELRATARQARWHQEGTKPYKIRPKNGKALAFGPPASRLTGKNKGKVGPAYVLAEVNHPGLKARPFMGMSEGDETMVSELAIAWLDLTPDSPSSPPTA